MSWTTIATAVTGSIIPASFWNQQIVGNLAQSETSVMTAALDLPYASAANTATKVSGSSKYQPVAVNTDGVSPGFFNNGLMAYVYSTSAQTLNSGTSDIVLTFNQVFFDNASFSNLGTNNERLTANTPGLYLITGGLGPLSSSGSTIALHLNRYNSGNTLQDIYANNSGLINVGGITITAWVLLNSGDYVKLLVDNTTATVTTGTSDFYSKYLCIKKVSS